ncbi:hypothetical protein ACFLYH_03580 [Candidatus Dependentiae bacterium]
MCIKKRNSLGRSQKKNRKILSILQYSLILHIILLSIFLFFAFHKTTIKILFNKNNNKLNKKELPASLKPRKSVFGATVFFDDKANFTPPKAKLMTKKKQLGIDDTKIPNLQQINQAQKNKPDKQKLENIKLNKINKNCSDKKIKNNHFNFKMSKIEINKKERKENENKENNNEINKSLPLSFKLSTNR